jgi:hypothetical protein
MQFQALFLLLPLLAPAAPPPSVPAEVLRNLKKAEEVHRYEMGKLAASISSCPRGGPGAAEVQVSLERNLNALIEGSAKRIQSFSSKILYGVSESQLRYSDIHCGSRLALAADLAGRRNALTAERAFFEKVHVEIRREAERIRNQYRPQAERHSDAICRFFHDKLIFSTAMIGKDLDALHTKRRDPNSFISRVDNGFRLSKEAIEKRQSHLEKEETLLSRYESQLTEQCPH